MTAKTDITPRLIAYASTEGAPEMLIFHNDSYEVGADEGYVMWVVEPIERHPIDVDPATARAVGQDLILAEMGYRRIGDWKPDGPGTCELATVERM